MKPSPMSKTLLGVLLCLPLGACAKAPRPAEHLPAAVVDDTLGEGDVVELIFGSGDSFESEQGPVHPDGQLHLPCTQGVVVKGKTREEAARALKPGMIGCTKHDDVELRVSVVENHSKTVLVAGAVSHPASYPYEPGLTLVGALTKAGGLLPTASKKVLVQRRGPQGEARATFDVEAIAHGEAEDVPLQAKDTVFVEERSF